MPSMTLPKMNLPKIDAEQLFDKADAFQTKMLKSAEAYTEAAIKRLPVPNARYADRMPKLEVVSAEFFNRAGKIQSANRVFVKRVFLGETAPASATTATAAAPKARKAAAK